MVDNENNQWEDELEYTEDTVQDEETEYFDGDNSYPEEEMTQEEDIGEYTENEEEYEEEEDSSEPRKKSSLPLLVLLIILLLAGGIIAVPKLMNKDSNVATQQFNNTQQDNNQQNNSQSNEDLAGSFFDAANGDSDMMSVNFNEDGEGMTVESEQPQNNETPQEEQQVATVTEAQPGEGITESDLFADQNTQESDSIMVVYNKAARINPFKPPVIVDTQATPYETINNTQFEIIEPPAASIPDENLSKLLQTQISGIMYDSQSPAAIVNLNGVDHLN